MAPSAYLTGSYHEGFVLLSVFVAMMASYTALNLAGRVTQTTGRTSLGWLAGGAVAMGGGIWSMHFIGMLAFSLPIRLGYDLGITLLSLLAAIAVSAFALFIVTRKTLTTRHLLGGGVLMGLGICGMHYMGMHALRMFPGHRVRPAPLRRFGGHRHRRFDRRAVAGLHAARRGFDAGRS